MYLCDLKQESYKDQSFCFFLHGYVKSENVGEVAVKLAFHRSVNDSGQELCRWCEIISEV